MKQHLSDQARIATWDDMLSRSLNPSLSPLEGLDTGAVCASYMREERMQFRFMVAFQTLVLTLSIGGLILLLVALWQAINGDVIASLVSAGGTIVTGTAAKSLDAQRKDARQAFAAAQQGVRKNCPAEASDADS